MWTALLLLPLILNCQEPTTVTGNQEEAGKAQGQTLVFYEVRDLAAWLGTDPRSGEPDAASRPSLQQRVVPARLGFSPDATAPEVREGPDASPERIASGGRWLAEAIRTFVEPPFSDPTETARCTRDGTLVVSARPVQQAWVERFLGGLRSFDSFVLLETKLYRAPRGVLREWGMVPSATLVTPEELSAFAERVDADGRFEVLNAPTILHLPAHEASIAVGEEVSYVQGWELRIVEPGGREIADPQVETVWEGLTVVARTAPLPHERFGLRLELGNCEIERPIPTRKVRISASSDQEVEISEPEVKTARFAATVALADGASVVLVTADTDPEKDLALLVTVRRVSGPDEALDQDR